MTVLVWFICPPKKGQHQAKQFDCAESSQTRLGIRSLGLIAAVSVNEILRQTELPCVLNLGICLHCDLLCCARPLQASRNTGELREYRQFLLGANGSDRVLVGTYGSSVSVTMRSRVCWRPGFVRLIWVPAAIAGDR